MKKLSYPEFEKRAYKISDALYANLKVAMQIELGITIGGKDSDDEADWNDFIDNFIFNKRGT